MQIKEDIYIKGSVSGKLYYNIVNYYMDIVIAIIPSFKKIKIFPDRIITGKEIKSEGAVITGFSAGIDSFCTIYDHQLTTIPQNFKITHFLFNNVGSHGEYDILKAEKLFSSRFNRIKGFATDSGIDFIKVNTNLSDVLNMNFQQTHVPRNISSVLMLQKLVSKYYYASTYSYQDCYVGKTYDMAYSDPFAIHLLSTETLDCISSGCQHSRVEKTKRVAKVESSHKWLDVCVSTNSGEKIVLCVGNAIEHL